MKIVHFIIKIVHSFFSFFTSPFRRKSVSDIIPTLKHVNTEKVFASIQPGDIIIAPTSQKYNVLLRIPEGHRLRPMIVAHKDEKSVSVFFGSSRKHNYKILFLLDGVKYHLSKDGSYKTGYVNLEKFMRVPKENIVQRMTSLTVMDQLKINDLIWNRSNNANMQYIEMDYHFQKGQIIRKNNHLFYLLEVHENNGVVYDLKKHKRDEEIAIPYGNQLYTVDLSRKREINLNDYVPTAVIEKSYANKLSEKKKENHESEKGKDHFALQHTYRYEAGQVFSVGTVRCVYLFTSGSQDYGIMLFDDDEYYEYLNIEKLSCLDEEYHKEEILEDSVLYSYLEELVSYHKQYRWLLEEIFVCE